MVANVARELASSQPSLTREVQRLDQAAEALADLPVDLGKLAALRLARRVPEEHREIPVALRVRLAPRPRAKHDDPLDLPRKHRQHPRAIAGGEVLLAPIGRSADIQGGRDGHVQPLAWCGEDSRSGAGGATQDEPPRGAPRLTDDDQTSSPALDGKAVREQGDGIPPASRWGGRVIHRFLGRGSCPYRDERASMRGGRPGEIPGALMAASPSDR